MAEADGFEDVDLATPEERVWKILVVGDIGVGKTSFLRRTVHGVFSTNYKSTIGVDFLMKKFVLNEGRMHVSCQMWDVAGQERFGNMTRVYFKEARAAIVVCDNNKASFDGAKVWKADIEAKVKLPDGRRLPCLLLVTKSDLASAADCPTDERLEAMCDLDDGPYVMYRRVSAFSGEGCDDAMSSLVKHMARVDVDRGVQRHAEPGVVKLHKAPSGTGTSTVVTPENEAEGVDFNLSSLSNRRQGNCRC